MLIMFIYITPVSTILLKTDWFLHHDPAGGILSDMFLIELYVS